MTTGCHGWFHHLYFSISPPASEDESDDGSDSDDADEDNGASSPSDDEIST